MTIKSLLLGSAAALAAVSGAQAADAIVAAEPEPMEYVKVCDAAGSGYFYVPGTETCLKIGGYLRYSNEYSFNPKDDSAYFRYRLQFDTWNDSEYGAVYSRVRLEGQTNDNSKMNGRGGTGYFGIGGLEMGLWDSQWARFFGFGGYSTIYDGMYSDPLVQYVSYTGEFGAVQFVGAIDFIEQNKAGYVAGVKGAIGDWNAGFGFAYDNAAEGYTLQGEVDGTIGIVDAKLMLAYANKANTYAYKDGYYGFMALGSVNVSVTDTISVYSTASYVQKPEGLVDVSGGVKWDVATGFHVAAGVKYSYDYDTKDNATYAGVQVQRSF